MLKLVMLLNALSCAVFGAIFVGLGAAVAQFLGDPPVWLIRAIGAGLILNAAHLVIEARKAVPPRNMVMYFATGDAIWVVATLGLILAGVYVTTPLGQAATVAVAAMVGGFGILQAQLAPPATAREA